MSMPRPVIGNDVESGLSVVQEFYSEFFGILVPGMLFLLFLCLTIVCQSQFYFNLDGKGIISLFGELFKSDKIGPVLLFSVFFFIILSYAFGSILYQRSVKDIDRISAFRLWKRSKRSSRNTLAVQFPEWSWGSLRNSIFKSISNSKEDSDNSQKSNSSWWIDFICILLVVVILLFQTYDLFNWKNLTQYDINDVIKFFEKIVIPLPFIICVPIIVSKILGNKFKCQRKIFIWALFFTIYFFISVIISYKMHSKYGNQAFLNDINFSSINWHFCRQQENQAFLNDIKIWYCLFICLVTILLVVIISWYIRNEKNTLESLKKFLLYFNINKMIYFFSEVPKDYPYPYLRQYFIVRDKMNLLKYVPWCADTNALHQTKSTMNELKTCINYSGNQLFSYDILKNEATTRSLAACWSAAQYLLIWNMVAFAVYHFFIFVSLNRSVFITKTFGSPQKYLLFAIMVLLLHWIHRLIEEEFHRVRTREITTIFNKAYILENSKNDSGTNAFFDTINKRYDSFCNNTILKECNNNLDQLRERFLNLVKNAIKQNEVDFRNKIIGICGCESDADKVEQYLKSLKNGNCESRNDFLGLVENACTDSDFNRKITKIITTINDDVNVIQKFINLLIKPFTSFKEETVEQYLRKLKEKENDKLYTKFINLLIESFTNFEGKLFKIFKKCNNDNNGKEKTVEQYFNSLKKTDNESNNVNGGNNVNDSRTKYTDFVDLFLKEFKDFGPLPQDIKKIIDDKRFKKQKYCYYCIDAAKEFNNKKSGKTTTNNNFILYFTYNQR